MDQMSLAARFQKIFCGLLIYVKGSTRQPERNPVVSISNCFALACQSKEAATADTKSVLASLVQLNGERRRGSKSIDKVDAKLHDLFFELNSFIEISAILQ